MQNGTIHIVAANAVSPEEYQKEARNEAKQRALSTLVGQLVRRGLPIPLRERLLLLPRKWAVDIYYPDARLCVEYEGGIATHLREVDPITGRLKQSRHATPEGFRNDCIKYNALTMAGFAVMRAEVQMVRSEQAADQIAECYFTRVRQVEIEAAILARYALERYGPRLMADMLASFAAHGDDAS